MLALYKIFSLFFFANINANQTDTLPKKISANLDNWSKSNPIEKTFLHTDKSTYISGETIWYKAYVTLYAEPTFLSKIVYVDLVDEKGKVIEKQMRPLEAGNSFGDIIIPKNLTTGNYTLNAYTLWMLNYKPFVYKKNIRIYSSDYKPSVWKQENNDFKIYFFPEGGDLVDGIKSTVAFYAINNQGIPVQVSGTIKDKTGKQLSTISTTHMGYGKFELTPSDNDGFTATVIYNNTQKDFALSPPKKEGIVLTVNNTNNARTFIQVQRNENDKSLHNELLVIAQMYGKPVFMGKVNFAEDATGMSVIKKNLPAGIMHITVFDMAENPLAERLVFINNYDLPVLDVITDSLSTTNRGKNKFRFDLSKFSSPSVSVAITDADLSGKPGVEDNIVSSLLLTSDLKGNIYQPGYYFQNKNADINEHLDLLMLTHGWRRFKWQDVLSNKIASIQYPIESGITISGKATIPQSSKAIAGGHVDIITKGEDSTTILSKAAVNAKGEFLINDLNFKQKATLYFQGSKTSNQNANVDIILNKSYIDTLRRSSSIPDIDLDTFTVANSGGNKLFTTISQEVEKNKVVTLTEVKITAKKVSRTDSLNAAYASDMFQMGQSLEVTSGHYLSVWQFLREQVNGLVVEGNPNDPNVYFTRFAGQSPVAVDEEGTNQAGGMEANGITYYLNEINVSKDVINTLHPSDIALIKVFKGPEGAALGTNEGGIAIYTKKGLVDKIRTGEKGFFKETKIGYAVTREFFNPDYGVITDATPDNRSTLYWNANIKTDKSGFATLRFYNNDITKKYKIVIQGIDKTGSLIFKEQIFQ